ncbi:MAG: non-canonical purine NTP pyrophosphatase [Parcubacteria group bacterium]
MNQICFVPEIGKTLAEIEIGSKNEIDHRGRALEKFKEAFLKNDMSF